MANTNFSFKISAPGALKDKIAVIKSLRILTGSDLREAKDMSELIGVTQQLTINRYNFQSYNNPDLEIENQFRLLRNNGCEVGGSVNALLQSLRDLGAEALNQGEDDLANEILQLVLAEKLRRKP